MRQTALPVIRGSTLFGNRDAEFSVLDCGLEFDLFVFVLVLIAFKVNVHLFRAAVLELDLPSGEWCRSREGDRFS